MKEGAQFQLVYSGKRDGWNHSDFHRLCDGVASTVVLVKTSKGNRFGGFTVLPWSSTKGWKEDKESFVFSVD